MRKRQGLILAGILGAACLAIGPAIPAEPTVKTVPTPKERKRDTTFAGRLAKASNVSEEDINKALQALGPVMREELSKGQAVTIQGLGTFRIVRLAEYKDMRDGKPVTIPARNTVEFLPSEGTLDAANSEDATPAVVVPAFEYKTMPGQTPGQKMGRTRVPDVRVK
jgi:nucleoid DNA-binding protein